MHTTLKCCTFPVADLSGLKKKVLNWLRPFGTFCFLDNQQYRLAPPHEAECLVAAGVREWMEGTDIREADRFFDQEQWLFGHLSYELKNTLHHLVSHKEDRIGFPPYFLFSPQVVLAISGDCLTIHAEDPSAVYASLVQQPGAIDAAQMDSFEVKPVLSKEAYVQKIQSLQQHILRGDCYEINFCQAFFADGVSLDPFAVFHNLMRVSPNPFSAFYRLNGRYLLCASPERFLARKGAHLLSQPIKGTVKRDVQDPAHDEQLRDSLRLSQKERAENVMVVDLVRNDLTRICKPASVKVDELFGVYSFPQVHQLISTISGEVEDNTSFSQILEALFPMGSMTGAPKRNVMKLIDAYEQTGRGLFSGSVGYKAPNGDFDFNVVIRSIFYNKATQHLSYQVGSGITFYSEAEKEWEECMLKAEAIKKVLSL
ncbi:anthranilate synthase component I family protein [Flavisolibacter nicotianae]|uniref:anthranilate synthase component I family protein n=1 Tax=Flavisolibacter nicotianae TaxID=2364882 RepID=UPI000EB0D5D3|nr:anthranilate synthase component I family protein [Flavisolibacter nicotianae]